MSITPTNHRAFLHLGMTKTGSSFLQQKILAKVEDTAYLHSQIGLITKALESGAERLELKGVTDRDQKVILSHETLHGKAPSRLAPLLNRTFGEATILVVTRAPAQWLRSFYFQRIRNGEDREPQVWLEENEKSLKRQLDFDLLFREYSKSFGAESVYFLPYEMLLSDPLRFLNHVQDIAGLSFEAKEIDMRLVNPSPRPEQIEQMRLANVHLNRLAGGDPELEKEITAFRKGLIRKVTKKAADAGPPTVLQSPIFELEKLKQYSSGFGCLQRHNWYLDYASLYFPF